MFILVISLLFSFLLISIAEAMVASQESFLNSPAHVKSNRDYNSSGAIDSVGDATTALNEPLMDGSEKLARIRLACSRDSSTPSPSSITTVSVRTHSPHSSNPSPPTSVISPIIVDRSTTSPSGCPPQPVVGGGGLLYNLLVGCEIGSTAGLCGSPFRTMSTPTRNSYYTPSGSGTLRRSHTQMSFGVDCARDNEIANGPIVDPDRPAKRMEIGSRLVAALTASELSDVNGIGVSNGKADSARSKFRDPQFRLSHRQQQKQQQQQEKQQQQSPLNHRIRANSLGAHKLSQLKTHTRVHPINVLSNGDSSDSSAHHLKSRLNHSNHHNFSVTTTSTVNTTTINTTKSSSNNNTLSLDHSHNQVYQHSVYRGHLDNSITWENNGKLGGQYRSFSTTPHNSSDVNLLTRSHSLNVQNNAIPSTIIHKTKRLLPLPLPVAVIMSSAVQSNLSSHPPSPLVSKSNISSGYNSVPFSQSPLTSLSADSGLDEPVDLTGQGTAVGMTAAAAFAHNNGLTKSTAFYARLPSGDALQLVQLAKKTARPVQARVTEWMRQVTEFVALSAPVLRTMDLGPISRHIRSGNGRSRDLIDMDVWLDLLTKCWHRLLALSMVENAIDLVVVEHTLSDELIAAESRQAVHLNQTGLPWILLPEVKQNNGLGILLTDRSRYPDRRFANAFMQFLSEIRQASLSAQEFYLLRHVILLTGKW